jgi:hypothetical protein
MSSDGELSAIAKKEWEKRLKVKAEKPVFRSSDPEPDLDLIQIQLGQQIRIQADQNCSGKGLIRYFLLAPSLS